MLSRNQIAEIYARYRGPVWRYIRCLTGSTDLAEDLCQEVFLRVVTGSSRYEDRGFERAWLFQITRNVVAEHWRKFESGGAAETRGSGRAAPMAGDARTVLLRDRQSHLLDVVAAEPTNPTRCSHVSVSTLLDVASFSITDGPAV